MNNNPFIIEPIGTVERVLNWLSRTEYAQANISYSPTTGWLFSLYKDSEQEITDEEQEIHLQEGELD